MKKIILSTIMVLAATAASASDFKVIGKVTDIYPITGWQTREVTKRECKKVTTNGESAGANALGGMIIGGLIGKGITGDDKGAAAGAIMGGIIGADKTDTTPRVRRVCENVTTLRREETVEYYVVEYNWNGFVGEFQTQYGNYHVGQRVELNLELTRF